MARRWYSLASVGTCGDKVDVLTSPPHMAGYRDSYRVRVTNSLTGKRLSVDVFRSDLRELRAALNSMHLEGSAD